MQIYRSAIGTFKPMPKTTSLDLRELTEPFNAWCAKRRISRSLAIRQLIKEAIREDAQLSLLARTDTASASTEWDGLAHTDSAPRHCFTLRLTAGQREYLRARAAAAGISCSHFILSTITARDSDMQMVAGNDAVRALVQSNDLLGRISLRLSDLQRSASSIDAELIGQLRRTVLDHLVHASTIVSYVEVTRVGVNSQGRAKKEGGNAKPAGY